MQHNFNMNASFSTGSGRPRPQVAVPPGIYLRSSTAPVHSSTSSLGSLFGAAPLTSLLPGSEDDFRALIHQAFVPHIGLLASQDTDALARDKGFADFKDLIRPFGEKVTGKVTVRDSQGVSTTHEEFGIRIRGLAELFATPPEERRNSRPQMGVGNNNGLPPQPISPNVKEPGWFVGGNIQHVEDLVYAYVEHAEELARISLNPEKGAPTTGKAFYLLYLRRLLSGMPISPHETFVHPVACVIAISSRNPAPIETLRGLYTAGNENMGMPAYVNNDYLRYYVLVHDEDRDDIMKSTALFDQMKKHFGLHCHLLRLRSGRTVVTDDEAVVVPTCQWLTAAEELAELRMRERNDDDEQPQKYLPESEVTGIKTMVREMVAQSVIPYMEKCITTWNDQVASRRRGLSGKFMSMSKRFLGSSRTSSSSTTSNYDAMSSSYIPSSPEAQMRKLADFAFMLRDWRLAYSVYELLRTDFGNDKAWRYHAGAQEMTVISQLLTPTPLTTKLRQDTIDPLLDLACYSYQTRCTATYSALRCLLVSVELLRIRGGGAADDAAKWAVRALEMNCLGGIGQSLVTERVSACYAVRKGVGSGRWGARRRKTAMWLVVAARRWAEGGRWEQARRCVAEAEPVYEGTAFAGIRLVLEELKREAGGRVGGDGGGGGGGGGVGRILHGLEGEADGVGEKEIMMSPDQFEMSGDEEE